MIYITVMSGECHDIWNQGTEIRKDEDLYR